ncbi:MAG: GNAT family N-acetyltransferase [endosymbiont of Galathealinum brachiosum]|uniref:GNAT family N-acetyltransferase n=1 Tax=endosymbiont of Galathealinum brachiosum TaxID=2200906 RepID=A0A370D806_9GAMM|nr:MAG: GNAT family N-acetyltransferase [endosymbiont of Galathealinum brachiosum]
MLKITSPKTEEEFRQYYNLRWRILRKPWNQPEGSERDKSDTDCYHIIAIDNKIIYGVARLEFPTNTSAQLRYMAVDDSYQGQGIGRHIVTHMEQYAKNNNMDKLFLNARENAVGFYEKLGYKITDKTYILFDSIQHYKMIKKL